MYCATRHPAIAGSVRAEESEQFANPPPKERSVTGDK